MKIAVVSRRLPPSFSGQSMMLYRLLGQVDPAQYCLISTEVPDAGGEEYSRRLPGKYFQLNQNYVLQRGYRLGLRYVREVFNFCAGAVARGREIARIVKAEQCDAVLSCSGGDDLLDVPSGFIASRLARVPFYAYMFDTYSHMWIPPRPSSVGRPIEGSVLRRTKGIIVTNESVAELLRELYGVESFVIHNPCDLSEYEKPLVAESRAGTEVRIVYTGAIYEAHFDSLRNLMTAVEILGKPEVKVHLYTTKSAESLAKEGLKGPLVVHQHQPISAVPTIQRQADILFLPLAFHSPYPELLRVSSPSKVGEFLAAGTPVLVHAPADSFISRYFRDHECGLVIDRDDPKLLAGAIERLLSDDDLRQRLTANAWQRAQIDFSLTAAQAKFAEIFGVSLLRPPQSSGGMPSG